jgi:hypothetical protein
MKPNPKQAWVLVIASLITLTLWLFPPIAETRQIPLNVMLPVLGPAFREEIRSYHAWIWSFRPHQEIWFAVLIPRTVAVWAAALVAMEALRRPRSGTTGRGK